MNLPDKIISAIAEANSTGYALMPQDIQADLNRIKLLTSFSIGYARLFLNTLNMHKDIKDSSPELVEANSEMLQLIYKEEQELKQILGV